MKKALTILLLCGLVSSASAVAISWSLTGVAFGGNTLKSDQNFTASLVYIGNGASLASSYDPATISTELETVATATGTTAKGAQTGSYAIPAPESGDYTSLNGNVYALLLSYADSASGKTYYNLGSETFTISGVADATSSLNVYKPAASSFSYGSSSDSGSVSPGGGWVAVPEPSTAALALAGLALLLKRRKA